MDKKPTEPRKIGSKPDYRKFEARRDAANKKRAEHKDARKPDTIKGT